MRDPILGIDLGTSNTVAAYADGTGSVEVLADEGGTKIHPSIVAFHPGGGVVAGAAAKQRKIIDPQNTIYGVKRLIGRGFRTPEVQAVMARAPFLIKEGPGQLPAVVTQSGELAIPEISAIVLDHVRTIATARLGTEVSRAVVTVPASFDDAQRLATASAGAIAGLTVVRVLNEPTAAALAYGHARALRDVIAVYDFGGGTFDVSILKREDQVYEVLGTAGDTFLGGDDLDERIVERMAAKLLAEHRVDVRADELALMRLRAVAEQTKLELSRRARAVVRVDEIARGPRGAPLHLQLEISRDELVREIADLVERSLRVCEEALRVAGVTVDRISDVLLAGGTTKVPYVREQVGRFFQRVPRTDVVPEEAVAIGAALQAAELERLLARPERASRPPPPAGRPLSRGGEETTATGAATLELDPDAYGRAAGAAEAAEAAGAARPRAASEPTVTKPDTSYSVTRGGTKDTFEGDGPASLPPQSVPIGRLARPGTGELAQALGPGPAPGRAMLGAPSAGLAPALPPTLPRPPAEPGPQRGARGPAPRSAGPASSTLDIPALHPGTEPGLGAVPPPSAARPPNPASWSDAAGPLRPAPPLPPQSPGAAARLQVPGAPPAPGLGAPPDPGAAIAPGAAPAPPAATAAGAPGVLAVTPRTLGIGTVAGYCEELIRRDSRLPAATTKLFTTSRDRQDVVRIVVCQGESRRLEQNTVLGDLVLQGLPPRPRGETSIEVTFTLDASGILQVHARDALTGAEQRAELDVRSAMQPPELAVARERPPQLRR